MFAAIFVFGAVACSDSQSPEREQHCDQSFGAPELSPYVLPFPVRTTFRVIQSYCESSSASHFGTFAYDFDFAVGDLVVASRAGTVIGRRSDNEDGNRDCRPGGGNFILIEHEDGTVMQYLHLTRGGVLVADGARVQAGEIIGYSGDTGCSGGPHLHVELFRDREALSPGASVPFNYRNARGVLDDRNGLANGVAYEAMPYELAR